MTLSVPGLSVPGRPTPLGPVVPALNDSSGLDLRQSLVCNLLL